MEKDRVMDQSPKANEKAVVRGEHFRITVLTSRLFRLEYSEEDFFLDRPTRMVVNRRFPVPEFTVTERADLLEIETEHLILQYDKKPFSAALSIAVKGMRRHKVTKWHYGMTQLISVGVSTNLGGAVETLDTVDGATELEPGLVDRHGFTVVDDSGSMVMDENGRYVPAEHPERTDLYFFGYLTDQKALLYDYHVLSGPTPMVPRWALGNWWSRYYPYSEQSYEELMENFEKREVPIAVSVIDMDWHITNPPARFGNGWTGYTWNRELFPNPKRFLKWLHDRNLHTTLNIHPGDGIRAFEKCYPAAAKAMGIDPKSARAVDFDVSDPKYWEMWFKTCLHPLEDEGVDFWWIDWQQKDGTNKDGYDVLFLLNHYLYEDSKRRGGYGMILSRYAGLGSHRYPFGFSGDTAMTWASLKFQPYFTAMGANVGYGYWSHDIGGHMYGEWDDDMQMRWAEYGLFSPTYRPHSTKDVFLLKEPWNFPANVEKLLCDIMRLRHALVPYIYTMAYRDHVEGRALCEPLYFEYPDLVLTPAPDYDNEYFFGSELLVCPITEKLDPDTLTGRVKARIPEGEWFDFFNGRHYKGFKALYLYRDQEHIPVLAKAGAIVPMADDGFVNGTPLPKQLKLRTFAGADGHFRLVEDDGKLENTKRAFTEFEFKWGKNAVLTKRPVEGAKSVLPGKRSYVLSLTGVKKPASVTARLNGEELGKLSWTYDESTFTLNVTAVPSGHADTLEIRVKTDGTVPESDYRAEIMARVGRYQVTIAEKKAIVAALHSTETREQLMVAFSSAVKTPYILGEFMEILGAGV